MFQRNTKRSHPELLISTIISGESTAQNIFGNALCYLLLTNKPFKDMDNVNFRYLLNIKLDKQIDMIRILKEINNLLDCSIIEKLKQFNYLACTADEWSDAQKDAI